MDLSDRLDDQRSEIERYAAEHGYEIIRWCEDDAISGDATEKRIGFQQMREDAGSGAFQAVICWDQDRFGRFDSLEAGYWIKPFRDAGVTLVTVNEGPVNWNDFSGRLMYGIKQEGKHQFLRDLSRNTARGQISNAQQGYLCGQAAPYGYDRMLIDGKCLSSRCGNGSAGWWPGSSCTSTISRRAASRMPFV